ncbi:MAG TPA: ribosome small subunit-dependent GTPase A [Aquificaceae bacterium]|nr:ribosome small subunit-dependent GTPase A [Aquificaceae bacterium]HIQ30657.1 ribosome small subunit-dependent GTPase A [Aquifex aeolicus]
MDRGLVVERVAQLIRVYLPSRGKTFRGVPRGKLLRKTKVYAGDYVLGNVIDTDTFTVEEVEERKNVLVRPPVANVDRVLCVASVSAPELDPFLLDSLLVVYDHVGCDPVVLFSKVDSLTPKEREELDRWTFIYGRAGYEVLHVSAKTGEGLDKLKDLVKGEVCVLAGISGVGKSSILKALTGEELRIEEISFKAGRGRHTTTGVRLLPFGRGSFIGDTPGFSRVDVLRFVRRTEVKKYFREFLSYTCRYPDCNHVGEPGCGVREGVREGEISCERYRNYLKMIREVYS